MASILRCDHLHRHKTPYAFANERAELIHVNEQLSSLDRHISELNTLRSTLHLRTLQLHNLLSPIYVFPTEILSYIFQLAGGPEIHSRSRFDDYWVCLRRALVLSSVSSHFRHVAFDTPELWDKIPLRLAEGNPIDKIPSLLQHCMIRASNITVCVSDEHYKGGRNLDSAIETLFTCDVVRKVKGFEVWSLSNVPLWVSKFKNTFPMIESLIMTCPPQPLSAFDIGTLNNLTRLTISCGLLDVPAITVPPSVQYLSIGYVAESVFVPLLYQCPNLVECYAEILNELDGPSFTEPLILNHLKRLRTNTMNAIAVSSSVQHFQLPSLEFLDLGHFAEYSLDIVSLCCSVSASLTSLTISISTGLEMLDYDDLYQLFRTTFPKLRVLEFTSIGLAVFLNAIHALSPLDSEFNDPRPLHLPALESITLCSSRLEHEPRSVLDSLKNWWSGAALHLHLELQGVGNSDTSATVWTPALKEEFRLIKGSRHIEMMWDYKTI